MGMITVVKKELNWSFGSKPCVPVSSYAPVTADPFPCYGHDLQYVRENAEKVAAAFPMDIPVLIVTAEFEAEDRINGCCSVGLDYDNSIKDKDGRNIYKPESASIFLSGKRIPPHPAMTRYLVAHEYGHAVEDYIAYQMKRSDSDLKEEYRKFRGIPDPPDYYGGRTWHISAGEVFANDFRILVCGVEPEFWPHEGIERPEKNYAAIGWWKEAVEKFSFRPDTANAKQIDVFETPKE